jgi:hypothetical protein
MKKKTIHAWPPAIDEGVEAFTRAVLLRAQGALVPDEDLDTLTASWQAAREYGDRARDVAGAHVELVVDVVVAMLMKRLDRGRNNQRGWIQSSRDEIVADARIWAFEQVNQYRPGEGSVLAFCATRLDWAVGQLLRTHAQGSGAMDRRSYQVRAAAWAARARLTDAGQISPSMDELKAATLDQLVSDVCAKSKTGAKRADALAALRKDGRLAALERLPHLLGLGDADVCLQEPIGEDGTTIADTLSSTAAAEDVALAADPDAGLGSLYRVAVGDDDWAAPLLAARFGALGSVEGFGALDDADDDEDADEFSGSRGVSIPRLAEATGRDKSVIRDILRCAPARLSAPHAQWSHLATDVYAPTAPVAKTTNAALAAIDRSSFVDA